MKSVEELLGKFQNERLDESQKGNVKRIFLAKPSMNSLSNSDFK